MFDAHVQANRLQSPLKHLSEAAGRVRSATRAYFRLAPAISERAGDQGRQAERVSVLAAPLSRHRPCWICRFFTGIRSRGGFIFLGCYWAREAASQNLPLIAVVLFGSAGISSSRSGRNI
jgi:hypothetical protein